MVKGGLFYFIVTFYSELFSHDTELVLAIFPINHVNSFQASTG